MTAFIGEKNIVFASSVPIDGATYCSAIVRAERLPMAKQRTSACDDTKPTKVANADENASAECIEQPELVVNGHGRFELRAPASLVATRQEAKRDREHKIAEEEKSRRERKRTRFDAAEHCIAAETPGLDAALPHSYADVQQQQQKQHEHATESSPSSHCLLHGALAREKAAEAESRRKVKERKIVHTSRQQDGHHMHRSYRHLHSPKHRKTPTKMPQQQQHHHHHYTR